ncbi:MAG TPA: lysophospholipid acyltransferase family protein [Nitrospirota bacterium]|nr:lysophospholipid acyltransferase family protein [Nitrospirota bacterium]
MASVSLKTFRNPRYWYAWPALALMLIMSRMPDRVLRFIGNLLGAIVSWFPTPNRHFAERNIELCFPDKSKAERMRLVKRHFRLSGYAMLSLSVAWFAPRERLERFITLRDPHYLADAYARGKNVILLAPHFIGLDMGGSRLSAERKYVSMYRKSRDPLLEYLFLRRERFGAVVVERMASLKPILRMLREGRPFYYLPDQDMGERASVFAPFFGIPAATVTTLSRMAETTNAVVIPCLTRILPKSGYEVRLYPPLENFPTADPAADAARMNREIEQWVREMPEQYMWSYRRFKTRPNNEPSLYE